MFYTNTEQFGNCNKFELFYISEVMEPRVYGVMENVRQIYKAF